MKNFLKSIIVAIITAEAAFLLRRKQPKIIAVTGSVGKTSTKDAIYSAIKNNTYARKSEKSFNSDIGVPLTVLGLPNGWNNPFLWIRNIVDGFFTAFFARDYPEVLVLETGFDRPGYMSKLIRWVHPDIVVLTRLPSVPVHVEFFPSPEAVVAEKMKLVSGMKPDGVLIYNNDDAIVQSQLPDVLQRSVGFGRYLETDITAREDRIVYRDDLPVGVEFSVFYHNEPYKIFINDTVGTQHVYSCCAAIAVSNELDIPIEEAVGSIQSLKTPNGRMRIIPGLKSSILIDDSYNSSPLAVEQALLALQGIAYAKEKSLSWETCLNWENIHLPNIEEWVL